MAANFPISFRNQTLRQHRRTILFEREKGILPAIQIFVELKNNIARAQALQASMYPNLNKVTVALGKLRTAMRNAAAEYLPLKLLRDTAVIDKRIQSAEERAAYKAAKEVRNTTRDAYDKFYNEEYAPIQKSIGEIHREIYRLNRHYETGEDGAPGEKVRREFLMRCPADGCRGFLSTAYKCGVCEKSTCPDCLEILGDKGCADVPFGAAEAHTCNPDSIESAKAIKKETRPCPKCAARIFKIDGCDQMWCTVEGCNTAFSWNSGHIVSGRVHNPHYYEWLRRNGGGAAPEREVGDIPCGGLPPVWAFNRCVMGLQQATSEEKHKLLEMFRNTTEFEERLRDYPARRDAMANKEINILYLMNKLGEDDWKRELEMKEARFNRKKEIGQILQTLVTAAADMLQAIWRTITEFDHKRSDADPIEWIRGSALPHMESLRTYTNEAFVRLGENLHMAVPQVSDTWAWSPSRALYKPQKPTKIVPDAPSPTAAPA